MRVERERRGSRTGWQCGRAPARAVADSWCHVSYESALRGDERSARSGREPRAGPCVAGRENRVCLFFNCVETLCIVAKDLF